MNYIQISVVSFENGRGWRGDSVARSTCCSCRGPDLDSQYLHGSSQTPVIPFSKGWMPSPASACTVHA